MSSLDLRLRLKRDLSFSNHGSLNGSSHGSSLRSAKRWKTEDGSFQRKVSFGHLNETVLFDKKDSSSNLSLGVSVSNSSFSSLHSRGSANFRWGETSPKSGSTNASWGAPPPPPRDSRWLCHPPNQGNNMFFESSATANATRSDTPPKCKELLKTSCFAPVQLPTRCASPTECRSMEVERGVARDSSFTAPPRRPGRCLSPVFGGPAPPCIDRHPCQSPDSILPLPIDSSLNPNSNMFAPRPSSPATVSPRSSFNLGQNGEL